MSTYLGSGEPAVRLSRCVCPGSLSDTVVTVMVAVPSAWVWITIVTVVCTSAGILGGERAPLDQHLAVVLQGGVACDVVLARSVQLVPHAVGQAVRALLERDQPALQAV